MDKARNEKIIGDEYLGTANTGDLVLRNGMLWVVKRMDTRLQSYECVLERLLDDGSCVTAIIYGIKVSPGSPLKQLYTDIFLKNT